MSSREWLGVAKLMLHISCDAHAILPDSRLTPVMFTPMSRRKLEKDLRNGNPSASSRRTNVYAAAHALLTHLLQPRTGLATPELLKPSQERQPTRETARVPLNLYISKQKIRDL